MPALPQLKRAPEAAGQLQAFSAYVLRDLKLGQGQLDELYAVLRAVKGGDIGEADAIEHLSRSPRWVWTAMDPESKLLLALDGGERTLAMAQCVVHHVAQVLAPDCAPLWLTDGFREYMTALLTHYGTWMQPPRRQATGPLPKPRWVPQPALLYAQVVKTVRRRRLVNVQHRVVFGTRSTVQQVLAACGWQIKYGLCRTAQPRHPAARRGDRASGQHTLPRRRRLAAAAGVIPGVP
jgi:hypothetical protein